METVGNITINVSPLITRIGFGAQYTITLIGFRV